MSQEKNGIRNCYEISMVEYERELSRNEKLDNKINITFTLCGVVLIFMLKYLNFRKVFIAESTLTNNDVIIFLRLSVVIFMILACIYFFSCVKILFDIVMVRSYKHYDTNVIFEKDLPHKQSSEAEYFNCALLHQATQENFKINEERAKKYNLAISHISKTLLFIVIVEFIMYNFFK